MKTSSITPVIGLLTIFIFLLFSINIQAQVYTRRLSPSDNLAKYGVSGLQLSQPTVKLASVDVTKLLAEDEQRTKQGYPFRFGISHAVDINFTSTSAKSTLNGFIVHQYQIQSPGAYSINLIFDQFRLVAGAKLYLYNSDRSMLIGPITADHNPDNGVYWTDLVSGDRMIVELQEPELLSGQSQLHVSNAIHGYKDVFKSFFGSSGSCEIDLACQPGYQKEGDGVALLLLNGGTSLCSGALLNDVKQNFRSYFLTAFHCIDTDANSSLNPNEMNASQNWVFRFKYQSPQCTPSQDGTTYITMNGSTFRSARFESDFCLVEMNDQAPPTDSLTYLGWDRTGMSLNSNFGIHHPSGDVKKISITNGVTTIATASQIGRPGVNLYTAYWGNQGVTEGGSSGSPLFSGDRRIIGQLLGGTSSCTATGTDRQDYYGRFGISWAAGGSATTQLSSWLDPAGSNPSTTNSVKGKVSGPAAFTGSGSFALNTLDAATTSWTVTGSTSAISPTTGTGNTASLTALTSATNLTITFGVKDGQSYPIQFAKTFNVTAPTGVDVEFIIDDTGSMSEEIGGVRNALLNYLSRFSEGSGLVFQLTTFKDNVTSRAPTTSLTEIKNQVAALVASGGGDCPEASVEALDAVKDNIKDGRIAIIATDASPHAGLNIAGITASLAARGVRVHTLLSGDCSAASATPVASRDGRTLSPPPYSDNGDGSSAGPAAGTSALSNPTAIEAFSYISQETKGIFAYVPEVNGSNANDKKRYENIGFNILVGATSAAVAFIEPYRAPAGSTLTTTITGVNTNFNASSSITFAGTGISIGSINVISPTKIEVTISIPAGTGLGLKDIAITTGGEVAQGAGLLEVTAAPVTPTIVSITPPSGSKGQSLTVSVSGANTHFTDASVLNLGTGITVSSVHAISSTQLQAAIIIAADASTGYRNVIVTTGAEVANENVIGPFLVIEAGCTPINVSSVTIPSGGTATLTATGCAGTLLWSTGATTSTIMVGPLTESTTVSATCTTGACVVSATGTITVQPAPIGGTLALLAPTYNCATGAFTFKTSGGDGSPITFFAIGITGPTTNPNQFVDTELRTAADAKPLTLYATQHGTTVSYVWDIRAICPVTPVGSTLALLAPTYNCATGAFTFKTSGGNGSPITFFAIGITGPTTNPNQFVDAEIRSAADAKPITLYATQNGVTVTYVWDIRAVCPITPGGGGLALVAPTYNCATGAFTFKTSGGNGSPIEYRAVPGITDWTTNPNQFVDKDSRTANDVQPFLLQARQSGVITTLVWNLKAACGRARVSTTEPLTGMIVKVIGNPIAGETVDVEVSGVEQQPVQFQLSNFQGQLISEHHIKQAATIERVQLQLSKSAGVYLLQVSSPNQIKVVRVLKVN